MLQPTTVKSSRWLTCCGICLSPEWKTLFHLSAPNNLNITTEAQILETLSQPGPPEPNETIGPEKQLFLGGLLLALVAGFSIFGIELAGGLPAWPGLLRAGVALLTLGFTAGEAFLSDRKQS